MTGNLVEEALEFIRTSSELGEGSCSVVDESMTDDELKEEIQDYIAEGAATPQEIFQRILELERIREEYAEDIRAAGGGDAGENNLW